MTINWSTFLLEILNFLVLLWILKHFLYRPVLAVIAQRRAAIDKTLADAAARESAAHELETRYQGRLDDWEKEQQTARTELARQIEAERSRQLAALKSALDAQRQSSEAAAQHAAQQDRLAMEREAAGNGARFAAALLHDIAGAETTARLAGRALRDLQQLPAERTAMLRAAAAQAGGAVRVLSAHVLDEPTRAQVTAAIAGLTGSAVVPAFVQDPQLVAGVRIEIGTWSLAADLADELTAFAELDDAH